MVDKLLSMWMDETEDHMSKKTYDQWTQVMKAKLINNDIIIIIGVRNNCSALKVDFILFNSAEQFLIFSCLMWSIFINLLKKCDIFLKDFFSEFYE